MTNKTRFTIEFYHADFSVECYYSDCKGDRWTPPEELLEEVVLEACDSRNRGFAMFLNELIDDGKTPDKLEEIILEKCRSRK